MSAAKLAPILQDLERQRRAFNFDNRDFGRRLMDAATDVIERDMDEEVGPDGAPWPELSAEYAEWKKQVAPGAEIGRLWGKMKTRENLEGERWVSATEMRQVFGVDEESKAEAEFFQDPSNPNQPARPFYAFSIEALTRMDEICDEQFGKVT